ncbi:MAG: hypothetical protein HKN47_16795, partial [Pirellulaceae bacterium]|nr:hypothetical protein [Pirellulaceae bacterium]
ETGLDQTTSIETGGGVSIADTSDFLIINSTIANNQSNSFTAGGIEVINASGLIAHSTIVGNTSAAPIGLGQSVGGVGFVAAGGPFQVEINHSIVANNLGGQAPNIELTDPTQTGGPFEATSGGFNFVGAVDPAQQGFFQPSDLVGTLTNPIDPLLGNFLSSGNSAPVLPPLPGSPVIDAGDPLFDGLLFQPSLDTDQRGVPRVADGDFDLTPRIDIGAAEAPLVFRFNPTNQTVVEGDGPAAINLEVISTATDDLTILYTETGSAQTFPLDIPGGASGVVTFDVPSSLTDEDFIVEPDADFIISIDSVSGLVPLGTTIGPFVGAVQIVDDDVASLTVADVMIQENDGPAVVAVTVDLGVQGGFAVNASTIDGTALAGVHYESVLRTLNFVGSPGETQFVTIPIINDAIAEADKQFFLSLSNPSLTDVVTGADGTITITPPIQAVNDRLSIGSQRTVSLNETTFVDFLLSNDLGDSLNPQSLQLIDIDTLGSSGGQIRIASGRVTYTPPAIMENEFFTYRITDGTFTSQGLIDVSLLQTIPSDQAIDFGDGTRSIDAYSPPAGSNLGPQIAVVAEFSNQVSVFSYDVQTLEDSFLNFAVTDRVDYQLSDRPRSVAFSDDGQTIAVAAIGVDASPGGIFIIQDGQLQPMLSADNGPRDVAIGDLDNDGIDDFLSANYRSGSVGFSRGSTGEFVRIGTGDNPQLVEIGDVNGDELDDIIAAFVGTQAAPSLNVYLNSPTGFVTPPLQSPLSQDAVDITFVDDDPDVPGGIIVASESGLVSRVRHVFVSQPDDTVTSQLFSTELFRTSGQLRGVTATQDEIAVVNFSLQRVERFRRDPVGQFQLWSRNYVSSPTDVVSLSDSRLANQSVLATTSLYQDNAIRFPGTVQVSGVGTVDFVDQSSQPQRALTTYVQPISERINLGGIVVVVPTPSPLVLDVNQDQAITPLDALLVLNDLSLNAESISQGEQPSITQRQQTDVNGDGDVTPLDVLLILNTLSAQAELANASQAEQLLWSVDDDDHAASVDAALQSDFIPTLF